MTPFSRKQSQFELFPGTTKVSRAGRPSKILKDLTFSVENIIVLCIIFVMILVLSFSFGVERGKKIVRLENRHPEKKLLKSQKNDTIKTFQGSQEPVPNQEKSDSVDLEGETVELLPDPKILDNTYTIQVASFKQESSAQKEAKQLEEMGLEIFVLPKGSYSIVCVGKFAQKNEALEISQRLKSRYKDCLVRRL